MSRALAAISSLLLLLAPSALAKSHLWRFSEVFSDPTGKYQYIEMIECCGSQVETQFSGQRLFSNGHTYIFPGNLSGNTAHQWVLIATADFAALPGAPTPDFIIPRRFFDPDGDTLIFRTFDSWTLAPGAVPQDGLHSLQRDGSVTVNEPQNFPDGGAAGSVVAPLPVPALSPSWIVVALALLAATAVFRRPVQAD
jgi:hypothetical protein